MSEVRKKMKWIFRVLNYEVKILQLNPNQFDHFNYGKWKLNDSFVQIGTKNCWVMIIPIDVLTCYQTWSNLNFETDWLNSCILHTAEAAAPAVEVTRPSTIDLTSSTPARETFSQQVLQSSSSRREIQEGDIITVTELTESLRRVQEPGQSTPVTQRVTLTKTIRKRLDGTVLEENEDEVIDDIDSGTSGVTVTDALPSVASEVCRQEKSPSPVIEEPFTSTEAFKTGSYPDSLNNDEGITRTLLIFWFSVWPWFDDILWYSATYNFN